MMKIPTMYLGDLIKKLSKFQKCFQKISEKLSKIAKKVSKFSKKLSKIAKKFSKTLEKLKKSKISPKSPSLYTIPSISK